jgi:hypothetical protein
MDTIAFVRRASAVYDRGGGIRIVINGRDLVDLLRDHEKPFAEREKHPELAGAYAGLPAGPHTVPPSKHFWGDPTWNVYRDESKVYVLDCECGAPVLAPRLPD